MKYIYIILPCLLLLSSCSKFLEEYSTDQKYLQNTDDLNKLMIGQAFMTSTNLSIYTQATMNDMSSETGITAPWLHVMDDDSEQFVLGYLATDQASPLYMLSGFHNWSQAPASNILNFPWTDELWKKVYKRIGALNAMIFQASDLAGKSPDDLNLKHLRGEAFFLRAYYYFILQNIYGSPYRVSSAGVDEGVPLKISEKVDDQYFKRDNNGKIYTQIIADLDQAAQFLEGYNPSTKIRVGLAAVKALQSRVYLYTEQYDKALAAANGFEQMGYSLIDLKTYPANTNITSRSSTETIFTMGGNVIPAVFLNDSLSAYNGNDRMASAFKSSDNLIQSYDSSDLRLKAFFTRSVKSKVFLPNKYRTYNTYNDPDQVSCIFSFRFAEVILNRAEALAMMGSDAAARTEIQKLRVMRFTNATTADLPQSNQELVEFIRAERRRELCYEGQRWFDLRRYSVNSKYPLSASFNIIHPTYNYDAQSDTYTKAGNYVLKSITQDGGSWQVPIPNYAIQFNQGSLTNPVRFLRNIQP